MHEIWMIAGMAAVTYGIRVCLLPASNRVAFPPLLERALAYVPPAVLTAIIVPAVLMPDGRHLELSWKSPHLLGAAVAVGVMAASRNLLFTIIAGMAGFWFWRWLLG